MSPALANDRSSSPNPPRDRFSGILRPYTSMDVARLRGSVAIRHTLAELGAERRDVLLAVQEAPQALGAELRERVTDRDGAA